MNFFIHRTNNKSIAHVTYYKKKILCYVGKNGIGKKKREGDLITPKGWYKMEKIFYREDKVSNLRSSLPTFRIKKNCAWCVDSKHPDYNSLIRKPSKYKYEELFRDDDLYDIVIVLDFNLNPSIKHKGSAIFIHCCSQEKNYTEGCIALKKKNLIELIKHITPLSKLVIY